jgi:spermidine/putrescine transport system ATP-binding protein
MTQPILQLRNLTKRFGPGVAAVDDVSLDVAAGEFLTLLGASGSGKTTTLRMIAGFEHPSNGEILMDGQPLTQLPPFKRELNTVFQQYALFPHMSVRDNVGYGLRMRKAARAEIAERVGQALDMVQLGHLGDRAPRQLSGGQQQRVALARALVNRPRVLLLDEPLGALDLKLRKEMQLELKHLNRQLGITFLYVTHDQEEALTMSDRIALMRNGRIEQLSGPREMYEQPISRYVADFIGETNLLSGVVEEMGGPADGRTGGPAVQRVRIRVEGVSLEGAASRPVRAGEKAWLAIRPEHIQLAEPQAGPNRLSVTVRDVVFTGVVTRVHTTLADGSPLVIHWPSEQSPPELGATITVCLSPERVRCLGD